MANPNVLFKRGYQASLPAKGAATDGVFYLTTDTHRLYVGQGSDPVLLNQTVEFVNSIAELTAKSQKWTPAEKEAHLHDLYYVLPGAGDASNTTGGNILAVWCYDTTQNDYAWVQINPDHNTYVTKIALEALAGSANDANVTIRMNRNDGDSQTVTFNVKGEGKTIEVEAAANKAGFILKGDTYSLSRPATGEIRLNSALGQDPSSIKLVQGENITIADGTANNEIQISAHDTRNSNVTLGLNSTNGAIDITILDTNGDEKKASTGAIAMKYGASGNLSAPLGGTMSVYSKGEIDTLLNNLNGLTFIGSVGENGTYSLSDVDYKVYQGSTALDLHNGDMFLVAGDVKYGADAYAKTGDLLIATGTETDGKLTSVTWTYVPSGDDAQLDTSYHFDGSVADNTMTIRSKTTFGDEGIAGKMTFKAGTATTVSSEIDGNTSEKNEFLTVTVGHANVPNTKVNASDDNAIDLSSASAVDVITGVTVNEQGHVENVTATRVLATRYQLAAFPKLTAATSGIETSVQVQQGLVLNGDVTYQTTGYKLQSDSLKLSVKSGNVQIDCVWGDF